MSQYCLFTIRPFFCMSSHDRVFQILPGLPSFLGIGPGFRRGCPKWHLDILGCKLLGQDHRHDSCQNRVFWARMIHRNRSIRLILVDLVLPSVYPARRAIFKTDGAYEMVLFLQEFPDHQHGYQGRFPSTDSKNISFAWAIHCGALFQRKGRERERYEFVPPYYNPVYFNPAPVAPLTFTAPAVTPAPTAAIAALTSLIPLTPVTTIAGVIIADFIINTGNPQVTALLNLIIQDPTLLDNPLLLNSLINTGNPDVAAALAWLTLAI